MHELLKNDIRADFDEILALDEVRLGNFNNEFRAVMGLAWECVEDNKIEMFYWHCQNIISLLEKVKALDYKYNIQYVVWRAVKGLS